MRYLKFCFLLFMRDFLTTSDLAHKSGYTPQQIRNLWNAGRLLAAEVINPGGKQLRFKKTQEIEDWCANKRRSLPTRPVDYRLWYKLVERCKELEKRDGLIRRGAGIRLISTNGWNSWSKSPRVLDYGLWLWMRRADALEKRAEQLRREKGKRGGGLPNQQE